MDAREEIKKALKTIYTKDDTIEIRAFDPTGVRRVGRYKLGWDAVEAIAKEDQLGRNVYVVLNPTSLPPLLIAAEQSGTKETDVLRRRHFLLDFDPIRDKNQIATDEQHAATIALAETIRDYLNSEWDVVLASSGNGTHLLVPVDLPNDEDSKNLIRRVQRGIAAKFSTPEINIECFPDAARLVRAYGTVNRKGTQTDTLKYRRSYICP